MTAQGYVDSVLELVASKYDEYYATYQESL